MKLSLIVAFSVLLVGCITDDNEARKALDDQGFTNITITDRGTGLVTWEGCGKDDGAYYKATATNPAGKRVNVVVCCGGSFSMKGCVIRSK